MRIEPKTIRTVGVAPNHYTTRPIPLEWQTDRFIRTSVSVAWSLSEKNILKTIKLRKRRHSEGDGCSLKRGKWRAVTLVNALKMAKIRSNLHTGTQVNSAVSCFSRQSAQIRTSAKRKRVTRASPLWTDWTNISDHIRGRIINISTEIGHLYVQHYILLD